jgi:sterol desaturase/sphingolipid hydroxylase (fatty acid hydroxylase superfamily)
VARSALWLGLVLFVLEGLLLYAFLEAKLFNRGDVSLRNTAAFVLFEVGIFAVLAGVFFAVVDARKPVVQRRVHQGVHSWVVESILSGERPAALEAAPEELLSSVVHSFSGRRASAVLLAVGFTLITLAAAGSGVVSVSVGSGTPAPSSAPTSSAPTP